MTTTRRSIVRAGLLAAAGFLFLGADSAFAQYNTYEDVPFNQGSLFYRPSGRRPPRTTSVAPRTVAPATTTYYVAQAGYVSIPQGGQNVTYYVPKPGYYSFPAQAPARRGLLGRAR
jgi:hypothetical protein